VHPPERRWNHNIHYLPVLLAALPQRCERALDVGCGEGTLTRELRGRVARVTGIDRDPALIALADAASGAGEIEYVCADFMTHAFEPASFDFIASVAALHHMDEAAALARMAGLLAPGGCLALLGIPHTSLPRELPRELAAGPSPHRAPARHMGVAGGGRGAATHLCRASQPPGPCAARSSPAPPPALALLADLD